jgi:pyroglutamyl-peptidase
MRRILVTGFEPFLDYRINPSAQLAEALHGLPVPGFEVVGAVLPVAFAAADAALARLIDQLEPAAVIGFGLNGDLEELRLERVALNIDEASQPDNAGIRRCGAPIDPEGPVGYWSTLPLASLAEQLRGAGLPVAFSRDAGGYLCNHVFFQARRLLERRGTPVPCGFIHVPPLPEQVAGRPGRLGLTAERLHLAGTLAVRTVAEALTLSS